MLALDTRRSELEADRTTFGALQEQLKQGGEAGESEALRALASSPAMAENPSVNNYYHQLENYQYRVDSMTTGPWKAAPTNPDLIQLKSLIATTKAQLRQAVSSHVATLDARIGALRNLRARTGASLQVLPAMAEEEARLTGRVQTLTSTSDQVRQDYQKARMAEEVEAGDVDIVDLAGTPYAPVWATAPLKLGLGLLLGFLLGTGGAFILEALNTSIRRPEDLEHALHVPGLAVIPRLTGRRPAQRARLGGLLGPGKKAPGQEPRRRPGSGLAAVLGGARGIPDAAHQPDLVRAGRQDEDSGRDQRGPGRGQDHDRREPRGDVRLRWVAGASGRLRRAAPQAARSLPGPPLAGLDGAADPSASAASNGVESLSFDPGKGRTESGRSVIDVVRPTKVRGLSILTCGALPINASNLLSGVRMQVLLEELAKSFDLVILDTPPVLATADAGILGAIADGVLLVVRAGQTDRVAAQRAHQQLVHVGARIVGTVLNDPGGEVSQYGDYYYPYDYAAEEA